MKYFTIKELSDSATAQQKRIDNKPDQQQINSLTALVDNVLDPLREKFGRPIIINSGFRCPALNKAVGGAATSQHAKGEAADIDTGTWAGNKELYDIIRKELPFDQLIDEKNFSWVHVSYKSSGNRKQLLKL